MLLYYGTDKQFFRNKTQVSTKSINSKFAEHMETGWVIIESKNSLVSIK